MKNNKKFSEVKVGHIVTYYSDLLGSISEAVVSEVNEKMFTLSTLRSWKNPNGIISFDEIKMQFYKTGTKSHHRYTHGNAIEITSAVNLFED
jgi:hypothetical protein